MMKNKCWSAGLSCVTALLVSAGLSACGGSDDTPTLGGTAAIGAPIVGGTVSVRCAAGSTLQTTTSSTGAWQVVTSGQTLPCKIEVSGGGLAQPLYSVALSFGTANITPLTDLVVANFAASLPAAWFADASTSNFQAINASAVSGAVTQIRTALGLSAINSLDPISSSFNPTPGNPMDGALEALMTVVSNYNALLAAASSGTLSTFLQPYSGALQTAYSNAVASGGTSGGGAGTGGSNTSCASNETAMTFSTSSSGGLYSNGQQVCFNASATALSFSGKTLGNPSVNSQVTAPYAAYTFADGNTSYEVILNAGALYEINLMQSSTFVGQFVPNGGNGSATGGTSTLTIQATVGGFVTPDITLTNIPKPSTQSEFCSAVNDASSDLSLSKALGATGSFTVTGCSFANDVGTVDATLSITSPVALTTPYHVVYTYR